MYSNHMLYINYLPEHRFRKGHARSLQTNNSQKMDTYRMFRNTPGIENVLKMRRIESNNLNRQHMFTVSFSCYVRFNKQDTSRKHVAESRNVYESTGAEKSFSKSWRRRTHQLVLTITSGNIFIIQTDKNTQRYRKSTKCQTDLKYKQNHQSSKALFRWDSFNWDDQFLIVF